MKEDKDLEREGLDLGNLASHNQLPTGRRTARRRRLMKRELSRGVKLWARLFMSLALLFSVPLAATKAQSGRNKPASTRPVSIPQGGGSTRPKRAGAPETSQQKPSNQGQTTTSTSNKSILNEEPPPMPVKTPLPQTQSREAKEDGDEVDAGDVIRINSNLVTVPATVVDRLGKAVADLRLEDFELRVDGQPRQISELGRNETPVQLVMLFDNSSSLSEAREFEKQAAVRFFRSVIRPVDQAAIYSVSTIPVLEQGFTNNVGSLVRTIEHFGKPEGATALFDTIVMAAAYLQPYQGRKVIVIVSDGADTISDLSFEATLQRTLAADCQVYAVQTGQIENANLHDLAAERRLETLTGQTGGAVYVPKGNDDLDNAFAQINADLAQQYVLSYYPTDEPRDGRFHTISLRVQTRQGLRVRARKGYYATVNQRRSAIVIPASSNETQQAALRTEAGGQMYQPVSGALNSSSLTSSANAPDSMAVNSRSVEYETRSSGPPDPDDVSNRAASTSSPYASNQSSNSSNNSSSSKERSSPGSTNNASSSKPDNKTAASPTASSTTSKQPAPPNAPVTGGVLNGKAVSLPKPLYSVAARSFGASGVVNVEVLIDENGVVISARAVSGHSMLRLEAVKAAYQARFSPTFLSGKPVKVSGLLTYNFVAPK